MTENGVRRHLAAVVVADVVGYSRLVSADEAGTVAAVNERWERVLKPVVNENGGWVIKFMGDGALIEFPSAVDAVRAALKLQRLMSEANTLAEAPPIQLRIGINLGDVISDGGDIFGDDVNIAARLEALAKPGELCVSQSVHDAVRGKVELFAEALGEVDLKNIGKKVTAYRVLDIVKGHAKSDQVKSDQVNLWDNGLSIAVLPFDNMSGMPEQDFIGEGIAENILTDLSRFRDLTVIARNSSFAYKGKAMRVQEIRRDLGVNYILEGSVQRAGDTIRVNAQLIDSASGKHMWADRYDRRVDDLFAVMDDITELIVGMLAALHVGRLRKAAAEKLASAGPTTFRAFQKFTLAMAEINKCTKDSIALALRLLDEAVDENPKYAAAHAKACWAHILNISFSWSEDEDASWQAARKSAAAALAADDSEAWGHCAMAGCDMFGGHQERGIAGIRRAVELNPNEADILTDLGFFLSYVGKAEEGLTHALKAKRLNPHHEEWYDDQLGQIYFNAKQYGNAVRTFEGLRRVTTPGYLVYLAASLAALGDMDKARAVATDLLTLAPESTITQWTSVAFAPYVDPLDREHLAANLRLAGVPD